MGKPDGAYGAREESVDEKHLQQLTVDYCGNQGQWKETVFPSASGRNRVENGEKSDCRWSVVCQEQSWYNGQSD